MEDKRTLNVLFHSHINPYGLFPLDLSKRLGITTEALKMTAEHYDETQEFDIPKQQEEELV